MEILDPGSRFVTQHRRGRLRKRSIQTWTEPTGVYEETLQLPASLKEAPLDNVWQLPVGKAPTDDLPPEPASAGLQPEWELREAA
jgi:hypothetical protein